MKTEVLPPSSVDPNDAHSVEMDSPEILPREELSREALHQALDAFAEYRGRVLVEEGKLAETTDVTQLAEAGRNAMYNNYALLEDVVREDNGKTPAPKPKMTICMAVGAKDFDRAVETVALVKEAKEQDALEIVVWANDNTSESATEEQYAALRQKLSLLSDSDLQIKAALQKIPEGEFSMSQIRSLTLWMQ